MKAMRGSLRSTSNVFGFCRRANRFLKAPLLPPAPVSPGLEAVNARYSVKISLARRLSEPGIVPIGMISTLFERDAKAQAECNPRLRHVTVLAPRIRPPGMVPAATPGSVVPHAKVSVGERPDRQFEM